MKPLVTLRNAFSDGHLLAPVMGGESREPMRALLLASQGERLTESELKHYRALTGREEPPAGRVSECHIIAGRRSGKSSGVAAMAVYASALCDYSDRLQAGERPCVLVISETVRAAGTVLGYIAGTLEASPVLKGLITNRTRSMLSLSNGVDIEVRAADFRSLRGMSLVCCIVDEAAFFRDDSGNSTNPDTEIIEAVRPGLVTCRGQLFVISSPYARRGFVYTNYVKNYGPGGDPEMIVAKGATRDFNSTIPQSVIDKAIERDPAVAASEWLGEFRSDLEMFVRREVVDACTIAGRFELPRMEGVHYVGFTDPSGGSADSFTAAVAHKVGDTIVLDAVRERRVPFSPEDVAKEFSDFFKSYGVTRIQGDCYSGEWAREQFRKNGVHYKKAERPKSQLYLEMLPALNAGRVELLDHPRLAQQLINLERRTSRTGRDSVDHPAGHGAHDDLINAAAGAIVMAATGGGSAGAAILRFSWT
jgi:hypothetical protein